MLLTIKIRYLLWVQNNHVYKSNLRENINISDKDHIGWQRKRTFEMIRKEHRKILLLCLHLPAGAFRKQLFPTKRYFFRNWLKLHQNDTTRNAVNNLHEAVIPRSKICIQSLELWSNPLLWENEVHEVSFTICQH